MSTASIGADDLYANACRILGPIELVPFPRAGAGSDPHPNPAAVAQLTRDMRAGVAMLEQAVKLGHDDAAVRLGLVYLHGHRGVIPSDPCRAVEMFRIAAHQGNPHAIYCLSQCYYRGTGVPENTARAVELLEAAVAKKHLLSLVTLSLMYEIGTDVTKDRRRAEALRKRATQGFK